MEKKFSSLPHFTSQEFDSIIEETRLGRAPKSISEQDLKSKTLSKEQLNALFEKNLSRPHTITVLSHTNVENGVELYKRYLKDQQSVKLAGTQKIEKLGKGLQQAANQIERKMGGTRID